MQAQTRHQYIKSKVRVEGDEIVVEVNERLSRNDAMLLMHALERALFTALPPTQEPPEPQ